MDLSSFFSDSDDPDSADLEETLDAKREELANVREQHDNVRQVVEERESTLRELRARKEVGADVESAIDEVEAELEKAEQKRSELAERVDALTSAIPILEERLEEARAEEVQEEYDHLVGEIEDRARKVASLLAEAAEISAETKELCLRGSRLANEHGAEDRAGLYFGNRANDLWAIFDAVEVGDYRNDEPFTLSRVRRGSSRLEGWLDTLENQVENVERPEIPEQMSTATPFDE